MGEKERFKGFNTRERFGLLMALRNGWKRSGDGYKAQLADEAIETIKALRELVIMTNQLATEIPLDDSGQPETQTHADVIQFLDELPRWLFS